MSHFVGHNVSKFFPITNLLSPNTSRRRDKQYNVTFLNFPKFLLAYWDVREIAPYVDAINIQAFDYLTPESKITPEVADYSAPLYATYDRNPTFNIDYQVCHSFADSSPIHLLIIVYTRNS